MRKRWLLFGSIIIALIVAAIITRQFVPEPSTLFDTENMIFQEHYTLTHTLHDDLVVVGESVTIENTGNINGNAAFIADRIVINGVISGDLTAAGDTVILMPNAQITGNAVFMTTALTLDGAIDGELTISAGSVEIASTAQINTHLYLCTDNIKDDRTVAVSYSDCSMAQTLETIKHFTEIATRENYRVATVISAIISLAILGGIGALLVAVFPRQVSHIEEAIRNRTLNLTISGLMSFLLLIGCGAVFVIVLALIPPAGIILMPILLIIGVGFALSALLGMITVTLIIGERVLHMLKLRDYPPIIDVLFGSLLVTLALHVPLLIPYGVVLSALLLIAFAALGIGAAFSTRLGRHPLHKSYLVQG